MASCVYESKDEVPRTTWTREGEEQFEINKKEQIKKIMGLESRPVVLRPGDYYTVVPCKATQPEATCSTFPDVLVLQKFRHAWVLVRNLRPHVPVWEGAPLPSVGT